LASIRAEFVRQQFNSVDKTLKLLDQSRDGGKKVLCVDYVTKKSKIKRPYKVARDHGFVPYATVRDLDKLIINKAYPPDCAPK
jgi:uncharacterized protein (TIGR01370 family)